jgi:hypothetical protein
MRLIIAILTLMLCMGVFTATAFAAAGEDNPPTQTLIVNAAWLDGETIRIDVTDPETGGRSSIAVPLRDYLREGDNSEFIAIQAIDLNGKQSGVIEIRNPFFNPNLPPTNATNDGTNGGGNNDGADNNGGSQSTSSVENPNTNTNLRPFTPDGAATVVDNETDSDGGREFFTIFSEDGNEFFLIIDRHRNTENVYFLNAVTEEDLMSLARQAGREIENNDSSTSAIPTPTQPSEPGTDGTDGGEQPDPEPPQEDGRPTALSRIGNNLLVFGGIVVVVGGLAYYIKVVRPKKSGFSSNYGDDEPDDYDYDNAADEDADDLEDGDED